MFSQTSTHDRRFADSYNPSMHLQKLTIVGVGLIGGSAGLAAKRRGIASRVIGVGRSAESLARATHVGAIDEGSLQLVEAVRDADLVLFCTPVDQIADQVLTVARVCRSGTILTDAGSTKARLVRDIEAALPSGVAFVGGHPLAGSEKRGPNFADANLFQNRLTLLTPTPRTSANALEQVSAFWEALGARVSLLDPTEHDRALAFTSHLPHLVAATLANAVSVDRLNLTATGFRDTTRVAAGDPGLWSAIFAHNRDALLDALACFQDQLVQWRQALEAGDDVALTELLSRAKKVRDALGN